MMITKYIGAAVLMFLVALVAYAQVDSELIDSRRAELETELAEYEKQIDEYQNLITEKQKEGKSLKRDISILNAKVSKARLAVQARNLVIDRLGNEIGDKSINILILESEIETVKITLSEFLQRIREHDELSTLELAFIYRDVSRFFDSLEAFEKLQISILASLTKFQELKSREEKEIGNLEDKKLEELELRELQYLQKIDAQRNESEQKSILKITQGKESEYKKVLKDKKKRAVEIRSQLFLLTGSPDIPFEKALVLAKAALEKTGVRPAFLLAIITQETELGKNIGQCNLPEDPPKYKWYSIMKPSRDKKPYLDITSGLGLDPELMPLSCPQAGGWGGAMGPAQFIPSTWILFEKKVTKLTGHNPPNPWDPEDAFMASAIFLADLGADSRTKNTEWEAAMRYFSGSTWKRKPWLYFYGDNVLAIAKKYQEQIDLLNSLAQR